MARSLPCTVHDAERKAILLRYGLDLPERQVAELEGVTRQAVNYRLIQGVGRIVDTLNGRSAEEAENVA